jgi:hypothetical protein
MIRKSVAPLAAIAAALAMTPAGASANPYPNGMAHRTYRGAFIECHIDRADYGWSLARSLRVIRQERQRRWVLIAEQGCRDGWRHAR